VPGWEPRSSSEVALRAFPDGLRANEGGRSRPLAPDAVQGRIDELRTGVAERNTAQRRFGRACLNVRSGGNAPLPDKGGGCVERRSTNGTGAAVSGKTRTRCNGADSTRSVPAWSALGLRHWSHTRADIIRGGAGAHGRRAARRRRFRVGVVPGL